MEDTSATGGAYGLGLMPTGGHESAWRAYTQAITTTCGRAWGHGGAFPGYYQLQISSPDGSRQAVLLVSTEEALLSLAQYKQVYNVLATAYCRGVPSFGMLLSDLCGLPLHTGRKEAVMATATPGPEVRTVSTTPRLHCERLELLLVASPRCCWVSPA